MDTPKNNIPNFTTAPFWLLSDPDLTPFDKVVWLVIKYRQGQNSHAWPSQEQIAKDAGGVSERTVQNSANKLMSHNPPLLEVKRPAKQGRGNYNQYRIIEPVKVARDSTLTEKGRKSRHQKVARDSYELYTYNYIHSFDVFWKTYPRKVGKGAARRSWLKIKPDQQLFDRILTAVEQQSKTEQWTKDSGRYIPHPSTWLNQERWDDEIPQPAKKPLERDSQGRTPRERVKAQIENERNQENVN